MRKNSKGVCTFDSYGRLDVSKADHVISLGFLTLPLASIGATSSRVEKVAAAQTSSGMDLAFAINPTDGVNFAIMH
jgi:hypothetical protein